MTQMLVSVSNVQEALIALEAGADIIDLKNPAKGALGALPLTVIQEIVAAIDGRKPVSATIGDLAMEPELLVCATAHTEILGVDIIKLGFFGAVNHRQCIKALQPYAAKGLHLVAVLFADQKPDFDLLPELEKVGFLGVMLDTASKDGSSLLDYLAPDDLLDFVKMARSCKLQSGLAGSIRLEHVSTLTALRPSYLGFRGAMCANLQRNSPISRFKVMEIKEVLYKSNKAFSHAVYA
jgi:uncharacterized protein (UPF0264 family)